MFRYLPTLFALLFALPAFGGAELLSDAEFRALAAELAPKVNLFHDAWEKDPKAEFYGGTTRDYLYWVKGKFKDAHTRAEAEGVITQLKAEPIIDLRSFIIGDSDVDIFTNTPGSLKPAEYGVRKIDYQNLEALDPNSELGKSEVNQGFIPAEKIRLGRDGFHQDAALGDGVREIHTGPLTVHFSDPKVFAETKYAKEGINHPILLAIRYLRLRAIDYYQSHGTGYPDAKLLAQAEDPASAKAVRAVIEKTLDGKELQPYLEQPKFKSWMNGAIQKSFRSYTNPTAAKMLLESFHVDQLPTAYGDKVEPINQYVFSQFHDAPKISAALRAEKINEKSFFRPANEEFPDGFFYHGTRKEEAFRSILFQGVLGSSGGSAGAGLYGVGEKGKKFSEDWAGDKNRLVRFPVKEDARIVDIRSGEGARVWNQYERENGHGDYEGFAARYGIDILHYPYSEENAFVVKNSAALGRGEGVYRKILSLSDLVKEAKTIQDPEALFNLMEMNNITFNEARMVFHSAPLNIETLLKQRPVSANFLYYGFPFLPENTQREFAATLLREGNLETLTGFARSSLKRPPFSADENFVLELLHRAHDLGPGAEKILSEEVYNADFLNPETPLMKRVVRFFLEHPDSLETRLGGAERASPLAYLLRFPKYQEMPELMANLSREPRNHAQILEALAQPGWEKHPELLRPFLHEPKLYEQLARGIFDKKQWQFEWPGRSEFLHSVGKRPEGAYFFRALMNDESAVPYREFVEKFLFSPGTLADFGILKAIQRDGPWSEPSKGWLTRYLENPAWCNGRFFAEVEELRRAGAYPISQEKLSALAGKRVLAPKEFTAFLEDQADLKRAGLWQSEWDKQLAPLLKKEIAGAKSFQDGRYLPFYNYSGGEDLLREEIKNSLEGKGSWTAPEIEHAFRVAQPGLLGEEAARVLQDPRLSGSDLALAAKNHLDTLLTTIDGSSRLGITNPQRLLDLLISYPEFRHDPFVPKVMAHLKANAAYYSPQERGIAALIRIHAGEEDPALWDTVLEEKKTKGYPNFVNAPFPRDPKFKPVFWSKLLAEFSGEKGDKVAEEILAAYPGARESLASFAATHPGLPNERQLRGWVSKIPAASCPAFFHTLPLK